MKEPREIEIENAVTNRLQELNIFPFSVLFTSIDYNMLSFTFFLPQELNEFLEVIEYNTQCDKSGYNIFEESNTIVLSGISIIRSLRILGFSYNYSYGY